MYISCAVIIIIKELLFDSTLVTLTPHRMNSDDPGAQHVSTVSMKLLPFWCSDPQLWFAQMEAQFLLWGISAQRTKFDHVVAALAPEVATEVRDIILNPPASDSYDELQKQLIRRIAMATNEHPGCSGVV